MPNSNRMIWPYPGRDDDPWFDNFKSMVDAQDASAYANREDRQLVMAKGGTWAFDSGTGVLSWDEDLEILSTVSGFRLNLPAGDETLTDGQSMYVVLTRAPTGNTAIAATVANTVPNTNDAYLICTRRGADIYFRSGIKLGTGESADIFAAVGGASTTDVYERDATFTVAEGSATQTATVGRVIYAGSVIGLSAELTQAVAGGTVTVNAKVNGVTVLSVALTTGFPTVRSVTAAGGTHAVANGDAVTIEVVSASYDNVANTSGGLTVLVALLAGVNIAPGDIADAAVGTKGLTRLSFAPALAGTPIAYGSNDPAVARLDTAQTYSKAQGVALITLVDGANIATNASLGNTFMVTLGGNRALNQPTNLVAGFNYTWIIKQDGTGGRTLSFATIFKFPGGTDPTITTAIGAVDVIRGVYDGTNIYCAVTQDVK